MAVWGTLEKKYLPSLPKPEWAKMLNEPDCDYWYRTSTCNINIMKEIWNLFCKDSPLNRNELIVLGTTFDKILFEGNKLKELCKAFRLFEGETSLKEQADAIDAMTKKNEIIAIAINQTSINCNPWWIYDDENEDGHSYNCLTGKYHSWLFENLDNL
jgi:hypothetical protein